MTKKEKVIIGLFIPFAIICLAIYILATEFTNAQQSVLVYPEGTLSDSLFVSQNNSYTKNTALPNSLAFRNIPYYVDVMEGSVANVGKGSIIQTSPAVYIYISEFNPGTDNAEGILLEEFPSALLIDYDPIYTYSQKLKSQKGYINGFEAEYLFDMISVSNGEIAKTAYVAAYDIKFLNDADSEHILIGVVTTSADTQTFYTCKNILDAMALTIRYDEKLAAKQEKNQSQSEVQKEPENSPLPENPTTNNNSGTLKEENNQDKYNFENLINEEDVDARFTILTISKSYEDMFINVIADKIVEGSTMTLYNANRQAIGESVKSEDGLTTQIQVGKVTEEDCGMYVLKITHYGEYDRIKVQLGEAGATSGNTPTTEEAPQ